MEYNYDFNLSKKKKTFLLLSKNEINKLSKLILIFFSKRQPTAGRKELYHAPETPKQTTSLWCNCYGIVKPQHISLGVIAMPGL